jgi:hypothetical protein
MIEYLLCEQGSDALQEPNPISHAIESTAEREAGANHLWSPGQVRAAQGRAVLAAPYPHNNPNLTPSEQEAQVREASCREQLAKWLEEKKVMRFELLQAKEQVCMYMYICIYVYMYVCMYVDVYWYFNI